MTKTWHDLLFAHWAVDPVSLRDRVPAAFPLDTFDGRAWLAVVPFTMTNVAPRGVPPLSCVSAFPELNVRTYVSLGGVGGVYFFSLDAGSPIAVEVARRWFHLPYHTAEMTVSIGGRVEYRSRRGSDPVVELHARYSPTGPASPPVPGTLEYFLTERYCLYAIDHLRHPYRLEIHHAPWPLQPASAEFPINTMTRPIGIDLIGAPLLHFSKRQDMVCWLPDRL